MFEFTEEFKNKWQEAYTNSYIDPHTVFARLLNCDRITAKTECYRYMYSIPIIRLIMEENRQYMGGERA